MSGRITGGNVASFARKAKKYVVDVDQGLLQDHYQQVPFDMNIFCDAKLFIRTLIDEARKLEDSINNSNKSKWTNKATSWREKYDPVRKEFYKQDENRAPLCFHEKTFKFSR